MAAAAPIIDFLQARNSAPRLTEPAPDAAQLDEMLRCALRSPDHAWLRPWRFVSIRGERRVEFGKRLLDSLLRSEPDADASAREKALAAPLRAPLIVVVLAAIQDHPKVPAAEQRLSAGCAAFALELAAEALGYAAVWRTGAYARDPQLVEELGGGADDEIVAFIYLGTRDGGAKALPVLEPGSFHRAW